ncbi:MAG: HAMP domain-containing sensor histidine kinase [Sulfuritalea sp.]|nr:HAMP domain-containing sensor histidine kinase [Sulfuritalea sp.]
MRLFDLSFRHKIPLWGSALIVASAVAVSGALMFRAYEDLKHDLVISSENLGYTLAKTLFPTLLHDDAWRAFELVRAPFHEGRPGQPLEATAIFVVDRDLKVLVSSTPRTMPLLAELGSLGADYPQLAEALRKSSNPDATGAFEFPRSDRLHVTIPVAEEGERLGTLVITHSKHVFLPRFFGIALGGAGMGALVLAILLPLNWYWGRHMAEPLVQLAHGMSEIVHGAPADLDPKLYAFHDELGQLFDAYRQAAAEIRQKTALEREVMQSERLAAVGRLAAGIAHEVNNPLGGMLMALDTLKQRGPLEPALARTVALLERGLQQITETVGALLVQARVQARSLSRQDFEDIRTLVEPQAARKSLQLAFDIDITESLPLPAGFVRQVLINLLLNAIEATAPGGRVRVAAHEADGQLVLVVVNDGDLPPPEILAHLFEPFVSGREGGHGLGLWVSYQTVHQLNGRISIECRDGEVRFLIHLPLRNEETADPAIVSAGGTANSKGNP